MSRRVHTFFLFLVIVKNEQIVIKIVYLAPYVCLSLLPLVFVKNRCIPFYVSIIRIALVCCAYKYCIVYIYIILCTYISYTVTL